ncbi:transcriptional regulator, BadM/Rrf2 family [Methylobacterium sp. 4-46]|uniref:RrF2 family transcriptional regulator n=1 Tax=unclassified Methylobacterium TaxID=2615210 RepID=UPI000152D266|nr:MULTISPECIES: Rrf2 family transcriptional regulator [Methylobacterium]ACA19362.1 transcriptional regulator, BadM/Rrf2 family [Methylobacterium sp. 4-46]WFT78561.1 Rrf2 family transcriptional regulator [Methylobacterium nodulans]
MGEASTSPQEPAGAAPPALAPPRLALAVAAVIDIALHARPQAVSARALAARHGLPPRHLETVLQALVRHGLLKGLRGPHGGYELARERRRIRVGDIARAVLALGDGEAGRPAPAAGLIDPLLAAAGQAFLATLDAVTVEELCRRAEAARIFPDLPSGSDFAI